MLCLRYILEELTEEDILSIDREGDILNCGIAAYEFDRSPQAACVPNLVLWNYGAPMESEGTPKTAEPEVMTGSR